MTSAVRFSLYLTRNKQFKTKTKNHPTTNSQQTELQDSAHSENEQLHDPVILNTYTVKPTAHRGFFFEAAALVRSLGTVPKLNQSRVSKKSMFWKGRKSISLGLFCGKKYKTRNNPE